MRDIKLPLPGFKLKIQIPKNYQGWIHPDDARVACNPSPTAPSFPLVEHQGRSSAACPAALLQLSIKPVSASLSDSARLVKTNYRLFLVVFGIELECVPGAFPFHLKFRPAPSCSVTVLHADRAQGSSSTRR
ncbi:hypothetical protein LshimejAT787_0803330 [Lyophyllum shimeji]|uniref:Uncharacterized protein n=1 Tax=Lyophyllum shimeji TaxID=47721 RepID=A0A9P3PPX1_LYOSH|nr:hypothetical protein LshimejAT787_0803330 [Lyophyllum shimeji]